MMSLLTRPVTGARETFFSIDIVRGLSAIAILVFHYIHFTMGNGSIGLPVARLDEVAALGPLWLIRKHGALAVMLFWMISGFVFMNVYAGRGVGGWTFFVNRFARLYPLHLLTLLVVAAVQWTSKSVFGHYLIYPVNDSWHFVLNLFMASEWGFTDFNSFNGPVWSISIEILIYLAFWIYVRTVRSTLLSASLLTCLFIALFMAFGGGIALCGVYFFAGASLFAALALLPPRLNRAALLSALILLAIWGAALSMGLLHRLPLTMILLGLFSPLLLALALSERLGLHTRYRRFRSVGDITYSTYLWHSPLQMLFLAGAAAGLWPIGVVLTSAFFFGYMIFVCLFGYLSFRLIERPAQDALRRRMLGTGKPVKAISAP
jgi:peptidoglycan/LPS O-acetylase OafA/YrhL